MDQDKNKQDLDNQKIVNLKIQVIITINRLLNQ